MHIRDLQRRIIKPGQKKNKKTPPMKDNAAYIKKVPFLFRQKLSSVADSSKGSLINVTSYKATIQALTENGAFY